MRRSSSVSTKNIHLGLLIIRVGLGISFIVHGLPKLMGGPERWEKLGGTIESVGITFLPAFWGFMGALPSAWVVSAWCWVSSGFRLYCYSSLP